MTDVIDLSLHTSSIPATYTGVGTVVGNPRASDPASYTSLYFTGAGNDVSIPLGDEPLKIDVINETDVVQYTWMRGMTNIVKAAGAGADTDNADAYIVVSGDTLNGNLTLTIKAGVAISNKNIVVGITA